MPERAFGERVAQLETTVAGLREDGRDQWDHINTVREEVSLTRREVAVGNQILAEIRGKLEMMATEHRAGCQACVAQENKNAVAISPLPPETAQSIGKIAEQVTAMAAINETTNRWKGWIIPGIIAALISATGWIFTYLHSTGKP